MVTTREHFVINVRPAATPTAVATVVLCSAAWQINWRRVAQKLNAHCGYNRGSRTKEQAKKRKAEDTEQGAHWRQRKKSQAKPPPPSCRHKFDLSLSAHTTYHTDRRKSVKSLNTNRIASTVLSNAPRHTTELWSSEGSQASPICPGNSNM